MGPVLCMVNFLMCPGREASEAGDSGSPSACVPGRHSGEPWDPGIQVGVLGEERAEAGKRIRAG